MITLNQQKFLWITRNVDVKNISQTSNDMIIVNLRDNIQITHCWKKNDRMEVIISDDQSHYIIPDQQHLEEIYRLHLSEENLTSVLKEYCDNNLEKC